MKNDQSCVRDICEGRNTTVIIVELRPELIDLNYRHSIQVVLCRRNASQSRFLRHPKPTIVSGCTL